MSPVVITVQSPVAQIKLDLNRYEKYLPDMIQGSLAEAEKAMKMFLATKIQDPRTGKSVSGWKWYRQSKYHYILKNPMTGQVRLAVLDEGIKRAYTIAARRKRFLRFTVGGKVFFRQSVRIPPRKGYHYLRFGGEVLQAALNKRIERMNAILR